MNYNHFIDLPRIKCVIRSIRVTRCCFLFIKFLVKCLVFLIEIIFRCFLDSWINIIPLFIPFCSVKCNYYSFWFTTWISFLNTDAFFIFMCYSWFLLSKYYRLCCTALCFIRRVSRQQFLAMWIVTPKDWDLNLFIENQLQLQFLFCILKWPADDQLVVHTCSPVTYLMKHNK